MARRQPIGPAHSQTLKSAARSTARFSAFHSQPQPLAKVSGKTLPKNVSTALTEREENSSCCFVHAGGRHPLQRTVRRAKTLRQPALVFPPTQERGGRGRANKVWLKIGVQSRSSRRGECTVETYPLQRRERAEICQGIVNMTWRWWATRKIVQTAFQWGRVGVGCDAFSWAATVPLNPRGGRGGKECRQLVPVYERQIRRKRGRKLPPLEKNPRGGV
jgi:hypothetical protein